MFCDLLGLNNLELNIVDAILATSKSTSIKLENVSKSFRLSSQAQSYTTLKQGFLNAIGLNKNSGEAVKTDFLALKNISANVAEGCSLGIVGRNGSGKSTLLKIISGIYQADSGSVEVNGRISALIELGAGFHPDFTGRENLVLGGVMFGLGRKEIEARADKIIEYAELEDFIDEPVRTYSSGMYMRLGFSLAAHTEPDILLVDEVLSVGDARFIQKCQDTISTLRRKGVTMVFVTHDLPSIEKWCDEAIFLNKGVIAERGEPRFVIDSYLTRVSEREEERLEKDNIERQNEDVSSSSEEEVSVSAEGLSEEESPDIDKPKRWGGKQVEITSVNMLDESGTNTWVFKQGEGATIEVRYKLNESVEDLVFGIGILRLDGVCLHGTNTEIERIKVEVPENAVGAEGVFRYKLKSLQMLAESYFLDVAAHRSDGLPYDYHHQLYQFSVKSEVAYAGVYVPDHEWEVSWS